MLTTGTPTPLKVAVETWGRFRESAVLAPLLGLSWRRLHSPTLFLWGRALQSNPRHWPANLEPEGWLVQPTTIEGWRQELLRDSQWIERKDLGAGSRHSSRKHAAIQIKDLAHRSLTSSKDVLALCRWLRCLSTTGSFLELGTSLGVTAAYVASVGWRVETWEGCQQTLSQARDGWGRLGLDGCIQSKLGAFQNHLNGLKTGQKWDVIYVDGFHEEQATLHMVDALAQHASMGIVVDDIAWSPGMHRAWQTLQQRQEWPVSFSWRGRGFLMKAPHMAPQHHALA